jgi:hypothetical protein
MLAAVERHLADVVNVGSRDARGDSIRENTE